MNPVLSVVVPCYGRHELLRACVSSVRGQKRDLVEIVVVDDGSDPPLESAVRGVLTSTDSVVRQGRRGRGAALRAGLLKAAGMYVLIMDSDDEFLEQAVDRVVGDVESMAAHSLGCVYECIDFETGRSIAKLPGEMDVGLLELRADFRIRGDLKEVVRRDAVLQSLYDDPGLETRVPTSYIWAGVAALGKVRAKPCALVRHRYLRDGMTRNLRVLREKSPRLLARTYARVACAPRWAYRSGWFRWSHAVKALSVTGAGLQPDEVSQLREAVGNVGYVGAQVAGRLVRALRK